MSTHCSEKTALSKRIRCNHTVTKHYKYEKIMVKYLYFIISMNGLSGHPIPVNVVSL